MLNNQLCYNEHKQKWSDASFWYNIPISNQKLKYGKVCTYFVRKQKSTFDRASSLPAELIKFHALFEGFFCSPFCGLLKNIKDELILVFLL